MRLFTALPLPPAVHDRLERLRLRLSAPRDGLRWSSPEQWHITLQFYGETTDARARCLLQGLEQAGADQAELSIESLGLFAAKGILFAAAAVSPTLERLHRSVTAGSQSCGVMPESRPFFPHVTLARSKGRTGQKTLQDLSTPQPPLFGTAIHWQATELVLLSSELHPQGARYSEIGRVPLGLATAAHKVKS